MSDPHPATPYELRVRVAEGDIDGQGHVNNVVYLRWAQDVAVAHWRSLAPNESRAEIGWVARRHEIDYLAAGFLGDELRVATWVGKLEGLSFERHTEITRLADGKVLSRVRTLWVPINPKTGRPKRVSTEVREIFSRAAGVA